MVILTGLSAPKGHQSAFNNIVFAPAQIRAGRVNQDAETKRLLTN
jgi:hypothetical protein